MGETQGHGQGGTHGSHGFAMLLVGLVIGLVVGGLAGAYLPPVLMAKSEQVTVSAPGSVTRPSTHAGGERDERPREAPPEAAPKDGAGEAPKADAPKVDAPKAEAPKPANP